MIIKYIKQAAEEVGVKAVITNSDENIETQLNRLTRAGDLPILLISWDIDFTIQFDSHGFMDNPRASIVCLLLDKPEDLSKVEAEDTAEEMAEIYKRFLISLHNIMKPKTKNGVIPITNAQYKLVPRHGIAKHSGVLGRFLVADEIINPCP